MKKILFFVLCAGLISGILLGCDTGNKENPVSYIESPDIITSQQDNFDFSESEPLPPPEPLIGSVSIYVWKDETGETCFTLYYGEPLLAPSQLSVGRVFYDIASLNAVLSEYQPDILDTAYIQHTGDLTKDEMLEITDMIEVPSKDYSKITSLYEFNITTFDEAYEQVNEFYPNAEEIRYAGEKNIIWSEKYPYDVYMFEVDTNGETIICAVSKEGGIFFTYIEETWLARGGARARED